MSGATTKASYMLKGASGTTTTNPSSSMKGTVIVN